MQFQKFVFATLTGEDQPITFYGTMNKLPLDKVPHDIIKESKRARKYGPDDDTSSTDRKRLLKEHEWKKLMEQAKEVGEETLNILTSDYTDTPENELVLNVKGNKALNQDSYAAMVAYFIGAVGFSLAWYWFVNLQYPEFFEQFR